MGEFRSDESKDSEEEEIFEEAIGADTLKSRMFEEAIGVPVVADNHEDKLPVGFADKVEGEVTGKLVDGAAVLEVIDEESVAQKDLGDRLNRMENDVAWEASNITASDTVNLEERPVNGHANKEAIQVDKESGTRDSQIVQGGDSDSRQEVDSGLNWKDFTSISFELHTDNVEGAKDNLVNLDPELKDDEIRELKEEAPVSPVLLYHNGKNEELKDMSNMDLENQDERSCELEYTSAATDSDHHRISLKPEDTQHIYAFGGKRSNSGDSPQRCCALYRLGLAEQLQGKNGGRVDALSFDRASAIAEQLEAAGRELFDFSCTIMVLGTSPPPEGPNGTATSYDMFVTQRSHVVQQVIWLAAGDVGLMNPVFSVEIHSACRTDRAGQGRAGQSREYYPLARSPGKAFATRIRAPPLPFLLSSLLQSRQLKLPEEQFGDDDGLVDDLDESSGSDNESEYDKFPSFKWLTNDQLAMLSRAQKKSYFDELELREKLFMKKQLKEKKQQRRMMKKHAALAKDLASIYSENVEEESGDAASVPVPMLDLALPASFDSDNPTHCFHHLDSASYSWDYEGVNVETLFVVKQAIPVSFSGQLTKDKKDANLQVEITSSVKHGEGKATSLGFDMQTLGKDMACTLRSEARFSNYRRNKATMGLS
ncbi:multimeric translocon complex in the outer envelope membrane 132 [Actinidia rufa]|uniref:Multimeric translocon complex in the outer envelope membrane 132 n=1 Tax=Actinidia rufa TaxID=165716 RepID=A0A7J0FPA3_9ERIC|nr:multimeric translocon complex in the outer envelope membrane 132 [Actinidia rufa]